MTAPDLRPMGRTRHPRIKTVPLRAHPPAKPVIVVRSGSPCTLLQVSGPVTMHAAGALRTAMQTALAGRPAAVVLDLSGARVDDPRSAEAMLVLMKRHARRLGAEFIVASPPWLQRAGTTTVLRTASTLAAALEQGARLGRTAG